MRIRRQRRNHSQNPSRNRLTQHIFVAGLSHAEHRAYSPLAIRAPELVVERIPQEVVQPCGPSCHAARRLVSVVEEVCRLVEPRDVAEVGADAQPLEAPVELDGADLPDLVPGEDMEAASRRPLRQRHVGAISAYDPVPARLHPEPVRESHAKIGEGVGPAEGAVGRQRVSVELLYGAVLEPHGNPHRSGLSSLLVCWRAWRLPPWCA